MDLQRLSRNEAAFIIGVPIAWGLLLLLHPGGEATDVYGALEGSVARGLIVHVDEVNGLSAADRDLGADLVQNFAESPLVRDFGVLALIGTLALIIATVAAGIALRRHAEATQPVAILIGVSGFLITAHPPPFGPAGLALFALAVYLYVRGRTPVEAPAAPSKPGIA